MPQVVESTLGTHHKKISVTITAEDYKPEFEKALKQVTKTISLPGFRKGMVPKAVVKKMHGNALFADEVLRMAGKQVDDYLRNKNIKYFAQPLPAQDAHQIKLDMDTSSDYTFDFEIGEQPSFDIPLLNNGSMDAYRVIVTHDMVQEEVERAQYKKGAMSEPESVTSDNDILNVTLTEAHSDGIIVEGGIRKTNSLLMKYLTDAGKAQFMGKKKDDVVTLKLSDAIDEKILPALLRDLNLDITDAANKDKYFNITLDKLGHVDPAPLDESLFKDIYPNEDIANEEQFRAKLAEEIQAYWDGQARNKLHNDIFEALVSQTPMELPVNFLKRWLAEGGEKRKTPEQVEQEFGTFDRQIRWQLISENLMKQYDIKVEREELEMGIANQVMQYFAQMGMGTVNPQDSWVADIVQKQMKDQKAVADMYNRIATDKMFNELEQRIKINTKDVSLDEFIAIPSGSN